MRTWQLVLPMFALFLVPQLTHAQAPTSRELSLIRDVAEERREAWSAPGIVFAVLRGEGPARVDALGTADLDTGAPMEPGMLVSFASVSKLVTATTSVVLAKRGRVDLGAPIRRYLPELPPGLGSLTLEQLLSHTAGLGEGTPFASPSPQGRLRPVCERMTDEAFVTDPGRVWGYTNMGYTLAGCVLEAALQAPFERVVRQTLLEPLGMDHTTFSPLRAMTFPHAQGHDTRGGDVRVVRPFNSARKEGHWEIRDYPPYRPLPATPLEVVDAADGDVGFIRLAWRIYRKVGKGE